MPEQTWLSYTEAARRVGRSARNVRRWHADGMVMSWRVGADGQRERVVREDVLLAWFRDRLKASPVHYYRMRALALEHGLPAPERPAALSRPQSSERAITPAGAESAVGEAVRSAVAGSTRDVDPLANVKPMKGGSEYRELQRALRRTPAPCRDVDEFTADQVDDETAALLAGICARCPVLEQCQAFADVARPSIGVWAGAGVGVTRRTA